MLINGLLTTESAGIQSVIEKTNLKNSCFFSADNSWINREFGVNVFQTLDDHNKNFISQSDRFLVAFVGNIFNVEEIEHKYNLHNYYNDVEVTLNLWIQYGVKTCSIIDGRYVFVVYDQIEKELFIVRDRMGQIPLYYANNNNSFVFSTSIKSIVASSLVSKEISIDGLFDYLSYQTVQAPNTILKDVKMLPLASYLHLKEKQQVEVHQYWNYQSVKKASFVEKEDVVDEVRRLFTKSVSQISKVGGVQSAFLSGGIDSSLVAGILSSLSSNPINTFNIAFAEDKFNEAKYARFIAERINSNHLEYTLSSSEFLTNAKLAVEDIDHPSGDGLNSWVASKIVNANGINAVFSGVGGDELFGGYPIFKRMINLQKVAMLWNVPQPLRKLLANSLKSVKKDVASFKIAEILSHKNFDFNTFYLLARNGFIDSELGNVLKCDFNNIDNISNNWLNSIDFSGFYNDRTMSRVSVSEITTYMQNVLLRDSYQMAIPHNLSIYSPFFNKELVEFAISLYDSQKLVGSPKQLLVDSFPEFLPNFIVNRPKMGFVLPWSLWLKGEMRNFVQEHLAHLADWDLFNKDEVFKLWENFLSGNKNIPFSSVWILVVLSQWKNNIDNL